MANSIQEEIEAMFAANPHASPTEIAHELDVDVTTVTRYKKKLQFKDDVRQVEDSQALLEDYRNLAMTEQEIIDKHGIDYVTLSRVLRSHGEPTREERAQSEIATKRRDAMNKYRERDELGRWRYKTYEILYLGGWPSTAQMYRDLHADGIALRRRGRG